VAKPPPGPKGQLNRPLGPGGGSATPKRPAWATPWPNGVASHPSIYFFSFFLDFFLKIKYVMGYFGKKNVKVVELPKFENLGGLNVTFETL
jgi:hypothetical protein